jgi:hypothetical protein
MLLEEDGGRGGRGMFVVELHGTSKACCPPASLHLSSSSSSSSPLPAAWNRNSSGTYARAIFNTKNRCRCLGWAVLAATPEDTSRPSKAVQNRDVFDCSMVTKQECGAWQAQQYQRCLEDVGCVVWVSVGCVVWVSVGCVVWVRQRRCPGQALAPVRRHDAAFRRMQVGERGGRIRGG